MAKPTSASDLFDNILPGAIAKNPEAAKAVNAVYVFKVDGENGGEWTVDLASPEPSVKRGVQPGAQCTIGVDNSDFVKMLENPALGMQLFMGGKLRIAGDPMLAMKLQKLFALGTA